jgi:hypothetical protein
MDPIPDLDELRRHLDALAARGLVVWLSPPGRGRMLTHGLLPEEKLEKVRRELGIGAPTAAGAEPATAAAPVAAPTPTSVPAGHPAAPYGPPPDAPAPTDVADRLAALEATVDDLQARLAALEAALS